MVVKRFEPVKGASAMLVHISTQCGTSRSTFGGSRSLVGGLIVSLTALAFIAGLEMSDLSARSAISPIGQTVNRALKGDRLPLTRATHLDVGMQPFVRAPRSSASDVKLPEGCEALVSSVANSELAHIAGRCVS